MRQWVKRVVWGGVLLATAATLSIKVNGPLGDAAQDKPRVAVAAPVEHAQALIPRRARLVRLPDEHTEETARVPISERGSLGLLALLALLAGGGLAVRVRRGAGFTAAVETA